MAILFPSHELNLVPGVSAPVTVHVSQGDTGRTITFYLINGTEKFPIPVTGITATVHGIRKDGAGFGPYPCTIGDGKVSFALQASMTAVAGPAMAKITLADADESVGSANFAIMVEDAAFPQGVTYDNDVSVYEDILRYVQQVAADATEIKGSVVEAVGDLLPGVVSNSIGGVVAAQLPYQVETRIGGTVADQLDAVVSAQLSDTVAEKIGPAAASWLENNVDPSGAAGVVDTTLTVSGTAADAKTTGDLIREIEADLGDAHGVLLDLYDLFGWQVGNLVNGSVIAYEKYGIVTKNILQFDDDVILRINKYVDNDPQKPLMASQTAKYNAAGTLISQARNVGDYLQIRKGERVRIVLYRYDPDQQAIITTALANVDAFPYQMEAHRASQLWHYGEGLDIAKAAPFVTGRCTMLDSVDQYGYWGTRSADYYYNTLAGTAFDEDLIVCLSDGINFGAYAQDTGSAVVTKSVAAGGKGYCIVPSGTVVRFAAWADPLDQTVVYDKGSTLADSTLADKVQIYKKSVFGEIKKLISNAYPPEVVSRSIDMTSTDKVYVYVGTETGWVHGSWYYYTDSWQLGGVYSALTVDTDATLSLPGRAADAKSVGDALATKLSGTDDTLTIAGKAADGKATGDAVEAVRSSIKINTDYIKRESGTAIPFETHSGYGVATDTGELTTSGVFGYTDYIDVRAYESVTLKRLNLASSSVTTGMAAYDKDKNYLWGISSIPSMGTIAYFDDTIVLDAEIAYLRCTVMVDTAAYGNFSITGNSRNIETLSAEAIEPICGFTEAKYINIGTGNASNSTDYVASEYVYCAGFDFVRYTRLYVLSSGGPGLVFYDESKTWIKRSGQRLGVSTTRKTEIEIFRIPPNAAYVRFTYANQGNIESWGLPDFNVRLIKIGTVADRVAKLDGGAPALPGLYPRKPKTQGIANVIRRAHQIARIKWTPIAPITRMIKLLDGTITAAHFNAGVEYTGSPYSITRSRTANVGIETSIEQFASIVANAGTRIYDPDLNTNYAYYGNVCSSFVAAALGWKMAPITEVMGQFDGMQLISPAGTFDEYELDLSDILLKANDHVVMVTGILADNTGTIKLIEISEATLYGYIQGGKAICKWYTPDQLLTRFALYDLYRYKYTDGVAYNASNYAQVYPEQASYENPVRLCCPVFGSGFRFGTSNTGIDIVIASGAYAAGYRNLRVYRDGALLDTYPITSSTAKITVPRTVGGEYRAFLITESNVRSKSVCYHIYANTFSASISGTTLTLTYDTDATIYGISYVTSGDTIFIPCEPVSGSGNISFDVAANAASINVIFGDRLGVVHKAV